MCIVKYIENKADKKIKKKNPLDMAFNGSAIQDLHDISDGHHLPAPCCVFQNHVNNMTQHQRRKANSSMFMMKSKITCKHCKFPPCGTHCCDGPTTRTKHGFLFGQVAQNVSCLSQSLARRVIGLIYFSFFSEWKIITSQC